MKIAYKILVTHLNSDASKASLSTWAKKLDIELLPNEDRDDELRDFCLATKVHRWLQNDPLSDTSFDYVWLGADDVYVHSENLEQLLATLKVGRKRAVPDPKHDKFVIGYSMGALGASSHSKRHADLNPTVLQNASICGNQLHTHRMSGAGMLISRAALEAVVPVSKNLVPCDMFSQTQANNVVMTFSDDTYLGVLFTKTGVKLIDRGARRRHLPHDIGFKHEWVLRRPFNHRWVSGIGKNKNDNLDDCVAASLFTDKGVVLLHGLTPTSMHRLHMCLENNRDA